jgi:hypothetical protein
MEKGRKKPVNTRSIKVKNFYGNLGGLADVQKRAVLL